MVREFSVLARKYMTRTHVFKQLTRVPQVKKESRLHARKKENQSKVSKIWIRKDVLNGISCFVSLDEPKSHDLIPHFGRPFPSRIRTRISLGYSSY